MIYIRRISPSDITRSHTILPPSQPQRILTRLVLPAKILLRLLHSPKHLRPILFRARHRTYDRFRNSADDIGCWACDCTKTGAYRFESGVEHFSEGVADEGEEAACWVEGLVGG